MELNCCVAVIENVGFLAVIDKSGYFLPFYGRGVGYSFGDGHPGYS